MITQIADPVATVLEAFFHGDAQAFHSSTGAFDDVDQTLQGAAVGQKIVDDQHPVIGTEEFFGYDDFVDMSLGEGGDFCRINFTIDIDGLGFFGEYQRYTEFPCNRISDGASLKLWAIKVFLASSMTISSLSSES